MSEAVSSSLAAVADLRAALEEMADALAHGDLDRLLACEARIESALASVLAPVNAGALTRVNAPLLSRVNAAGLTPVNAEFGTERRQAAEVEAARAALGRCRRLGVSLNRFIAVTNAARGNDISYGPDAAAVSTGPHALNLTV